MMILFEQTMDILKKFLTKSLDIDNEVYLNFSRVFFDKFFRIHILKMYSLIYLLKRLLENLNN